MHFHAIEFYQLWVCSLCLAGAQLRTRRNQVNFSLHYSPSQYLYKALAFRDLITISLKDPYPHFRSSL